MVGGASVATTRVLVAQHSVADEGGLVRYTVSRLMRSGRSRSSAVGFLEVLLSETRFLLAVRYDLMAKNEAELDWAESNTHFGAQYSSIFICFFLFLSPVLNS